MRPRPLNDTDAARRNYPQEDLNLLFHLTRTCVLFYQFTIYCQLIFAQTLERYIQQAHFDHQGLIH